MERVRAVIDSNAVDDLADPPERYDTIAAAVESGSVELLWTHITVDELANIPDADKRARLLNVAASLCRFVLTGTAVWDYSRLDFCRWADEDHEAVDAYRHGNLRHTNDALIASTAEYERCGLITSDDHLTKIAKKRGITVWTVTELAAAIANVA